MNNSSVNYGFDAPSIMLGLSLGGSSGLAIGAAIFLLSKVQWLHWLGAVIAVVALLSFALGVAMFLYGVKGKMRTRNFLLSQVPWSGYEQVLDIGTDAGLMAVGAAKLLSTGHVTAIDIWSAKDLTNNEMASAEKNVWLEGVSERVSIQTGDARKLEFEAGCFDRVLSLLCLHNIEDKTEQMTACAEIARVLKPGGCAVIGDYIPVDAYATALQAAGLKIIQKKSAFGTALALMFYLVAQKPQNG